MEAPVIIFMICLIPGALYLILRYTLFPGTLEKQPVQPRPYKQLYHCKGSAFSGQPYPRSEGTHTHRTYAEASACMERQIAAELAAAEHQGPAVPCPRCVRNHFSSECPPAGHRVTNARTGEVVGYWSRKEPTA